MRDGPGIRFLMCPAPKPGFLCMESELGLEGKDRIVFLSWTF